MCSRKKVLIPDWDVVDAVNIELLELDSCRVNGSDGGL